MMAGGRVVGAGRRAVGGLVFVGVGSVGLGIVLVGCVGQSAGSGGSETGGGSTAVVPVPTSGGEASSAGTGSATGDVGSTSGESGSVFIIKPDNPGPLGCDVLKQDCAEGEKCTAWAEGGGGAWNATKCVEVMGDRQPGEACMTFGGAISGMDDCSKGAMCWDVSAENVGICVAFCMGTADAPSCEGNLSCYVGGDGVLIFCLPVCDPLIQDCPGDALCVMIDDEVACVEDASGAAGAVNDPCELADECDKGLACVDAATASSACMQGAMGCCQPFCEFVEGEDGECPNPDQVCLPWFDPNVDVPWGLEDLGVCGVPG
jgi:hypothetical protein